MLLGALAGCAPPGAEIEETASREPADLPLPLKTASACRGELATERTDGREDARNQIRRGWELVAAGQGRGAIERFLSSFSVGPEEYFAYWGLGVAGHISGYTDEIVDLCLARAQTRYNDSANFHADRGRIYLQRGDLTDARSAFLASVRLDPEQMQAQQGLLRIAEMQGDAGEAERRQEIIAGLGG